ncbi:MAG: 4Fe-4S binding protein [Colwellia sp.]|nr:4Fe-4S binding protein [Colwellia sp.]
MSRQQARVTAKIAFFAFFLFAPILDLFRFDLTLWHFIILGQVWTISIDSILHGGDSVDAAIKIFSRVLIAGITFVAVSGFLIWKFGRIYCGWLWPHFSVVELVNDLMMKQLNRVTVWEKAKIENKQLLPRLIAAVAMAFIWVVTTNSVVA